MENKINTNYIPNNSKYRVDLMHRNLFRSLREMRKEQAHNEFKKWLYNEIDDENNMIIEDTLNILSDSIISNLKSNGFYINKKQFRDEMASLIYHNSY